jgi:hypothetical protein
MKIVLSTLIATVGITVAPKSFEDKLPEQSSKSFMDCICCLPEQGRVVQVPSLPLRQSERLPTLSPPLQQQAPMPHADAVQQQQPLTVPQQQIDLNAMPAPQLAQPQAVPVQLVAFGRREGGCGGGDGYYNYRHRRFGGRLRRA